MTVELIEDKIIWDKLVDESPYAVLSHKWDFLKIIEKYSGYRLYTYGVYKGDKLLGIYPFFYKRKMGLRTIYSPPMGALYLGFLVSNEFDELKQSKKESFLNSFLGEMENEMHLYAPDYTLIYTTPNFSDIRFYKWNNYSVSPEYTYSVNLTLSQEAMWNNLHTDARRCVRLADNSGLEIRMSDDVSILNERQEERYREIGLNISMDSDYLNELIKAFPNNIKVHYAYNNNGEIVSGLTSQKYNGKFLAWMGIAKAADHANDFLIWKLMEGAKAEGLKKFEINGANEKNLCHFKSRFNPQLEVYYKINKKKCFW